MDPMAIIFGISALACVYELGAGVGAISQTLRKVYIERKWRPNKICQESIDEVVVNHKEDSIVVTSLNKFKKKIPRLGMDIKHANKEDIFNSFDSFKIPKYIHEELYKKMSDKVLGSVKELAKRFPGYFQKEVINNLEQLVKNDDEMLKELGTIKKIFEEQGWKSDKILEGIEELREEYKAGQKEVVQKLETIEKLVIKIMATGPRGSRIITKMTQEGIVGADTIAIDTDAQRLVHDVKATNKILLEKRSIKGLATEMTPSLAKFLEVKEDIKRKLLGATITFITGELGGVETDSLPVISGIAKELNIPTFAVTTLPFKAEGDAKMRDALMCLKKLKDVVDIVIVIPTDKLLKLIPGMPLEVASEFADEIVMRCVKNITEMMTKPGLINIDYTDLKFIMETDGVAMIGLGESDSKDRATKAANQALTSPLLLDVDMTKISGALINVSGGSDIAIAEAQQIVEEVHKKINPEATIIWGARIDPALEHTIRVMIVCTGVTSEQIFGRELERSVTRNKNNIYGVDIVK